MTATSSIELRVLHRGDDARVDEVVVLIDGAERLARLGRGVTPSWIGRDERAVFAVRNGSILRDPTVDRRSLQGPPADPAP